MNTENYSADQINVQVQGFIKAAHSFLTPTHALGSLVIKTGKICGIFTGKTGEEFQIRQPNIWKTQFQIWEGDNALGFAKPPKSISRGFQVQIGETQYALNPAKFLSNKFYLWDSSGQVAVTIQPKGVFKRGALISIHQSVSLVLLVFTYFLVSKRWQEKSG